LAKPVFPTLGEFNVDLFQCQPTASIDLGRSAVDVGETVRRKKGVEIFGRVKKVVLQHIGHKFVHAGKPSFRRAALRFLVELFVKPDLLHGSPRFFVSILSCLASFVIANRTRHRQRCHQYRSPVGQALACLPRELQQIEQAS
jgi:hypothetical protein